MNHAAAGRGGGGPGSRPAVTGRVLLLRALGLGDFLTGVPAYRAVRRAFPRHRIGWPRRVSWLTWSR